VIDKRNLLNNIEEFRDLKLDLGCGSRKGQKEAIAIYTSMQPGTLKLVLGLRYPMLRNSIPTLSNVALEQKES
jgi:hypothetical protein